MKRVLPFLLVWLLPVGLFAQQGNNNQQKALVFTHVTVIDATGAPAKPDMTVVIKGDRIAALSQTANLDVPDNAHVVDATGKFLIPGLWDMHVHLHLGLGKSYLALFIANGVTGVRVMWGEPVHHKWRQEISAGKLIGPRMVIGSFIVGPMPENLHDLGNAEEGRQLVRDLKKQGWAFVKLLNYILRDVYFAIADEAKKQGILFVGHVPISVTAAESSDAGQRSIEHILTDIIPACSTSDECELKTEFRAAWSAESPDSIRLLTNSSYSERKAMELFARFVKNKTWVCPTLLAQRGALSLDKDDSKQDPRLKYIPPGTREFWRNHICTALATGEARTDFEKLSRMQLKIVGDMKLAGVGLLAGTDTPLPYCFPGFGLHDELQLLVRAGLSPMETLRTATYNAAKCLGKLDSMGTVERGKVADLVLLDADPLQDIRNTQKIAAVVVGGKIFQRAALQKMLAQVEAARLHQVAADGNIGQVKLLISEGADVNARDQQGWTPALVALYEGQLAVTDLLLEKGADTNTPHLAAYTGDLRGIKNLLEKDAPVDSLEGLTLLHAAAAGGHTEVVEFLIAKGFEATATTEDYGTTPLHFAALSGHREVAELLIDKGAEVNAQKNNEWGETPLHYATWAGHKDVAGLLIARGANVNARDNEQSTPLHFAVNRGHKDVLELLMAKGADVSAKNQRGESPLSMAKAKGHKEIVELLRKHGAKE